jgi:hypothetical protein
MRSVPVLLTALLVAACGAPDQPPPEAVDAAPTAAPNIADFAGTWENVATLTGVDEPVTSTMRGSASGDDWTMSLEGRSDIPMQVSVVGDSLIGQSAPYESILRPGVTVTVRTASVLQNGVLMGNMVATYQTPAGEERVTGTVRGTRVQ